MWEEVLKIIFSKEGVFAILFVSLLVYVLRDTKEREKKLHGLIKDLTERFGILEGVSKDISEIKQKIFN